MGTYWDVQLITSTHPIQNYEIEAKIDSWKRRHPKADIIKTTTEPYESSYYKHALFIVFEYQANSRIAVSLSPQVYEDYLRNYPANFNHSKSNCPAPVGNGLSARLS